MNGHVGFFISLPATDTCLSFFLSHIPDCPSFYLIIEDCVHVKPEFSKGEKKKKKKKKKKNQRKKKKKPKQNKNKKTKKKTKKTKNGPDLVFAPTQLHAPSDHYNGYLRKLARIVQFLSNFVSCYTLCLLSTCTLHFVYHMLPCKWTERNKIICLIYSFIY